MADVRNAGDKADRSRIGQVINADNLSSSISSRTGQGSVRSNTTGRETRVIVRNDKSEATGARVGRTVEVHSNSTSSGRSGRVVRNTERIVTRIGTGGTERRTGVRIGGRSATGGVVSTVRERSVTTRTGDTAVVRTGDRTAVRTRDGFGRGGARLTGQRNTSLIQNLRNRQRGGFRKVFRERSDVVPRATRHELVYVGRDRDVHRRSIWPRFRFLINYNWGPYFSFRYVYPYYQRKYVFVSLGGYWPSDYNYIRYYWYGYHPYQWYGYYPVAYEAGGDNYNYYTYNYYGSDGESTAASTEALPYGVTQADLDGVHQRIAEQKAHDPEQMTLADKYFENAVDMFAKGDYVLAEEYFGKAMILSPDDMILPFAYSQTLFAGGKYNEAARVLREALSKVTPDKEGVFYPRGLYADEDMLLKQIEKLSSKASLYSFDADLQLLLGYQLFGIGELDDAVEPLRLASLDVKNASSASVLLELLEKMRAQKSSDTTTED